MRPKIFLSFGSKQKCFLFLPQGLHISNIAKSFHQMWDHMNALFYFNIPLIILHDSLVSPRNVGEKICEFEQILHASPKQYFIILYFILIDCTIAWDSVKQWTNETTNRKKWNGAPATDHYRKSMDFYIDYYDDCKYYNNNSKTNENIWQ